MPFDFVGWYFFRIFAPDFRNVDNESIKDHEVF